MYTFPFLGVHPLYSAENKLTKKREGDIKRGKERQIGGKEGETDTEEREQVVMKVR